MVSDERTRCGTARDALKNRSLHLKAACLVEIFTHCRHDLASLDECVAHLRVHDEVHISLSVLELRIRESVEHFSILLLYDREDAERLAQESELLSMNRKLSCLCDECESLDTDDVTDVEELLPHCVVHSFVFARADLVTVDIDLDASCLVLKFSERSSTHDTP